jgi:hypothetical protein
MGTRHLVCVVLDKKFRVAQYGQWDGYPSGVGVDLVDFINNRMNVEKLTAALRGCVFISASEVNRRDFKANPQFSRDTSVKVLDMIQNDGVRELYNKKSFAGESLFCEWAYVLDLDKMVLEVYKGFNKGKAKGRFARLKTDDDEYKQVTLIEVIPIGNQVATTLTVDTMNQLEEKHNE